MVYNFFDLKITLMKVCNGSRTVHDRNTLTWKKEALAGKIQEIQYFSLIIITPIIRLTKLERNQSFESKNKWNLSANTCIVPQFFDIL